MFLGCQQANSPAVAIPAVPSATYKVVYYANTIDATGTVPSDSTAYLPDSSVTLSGNTGNLSRSGYIFASWNRMADGSGSGYVGGATLAQESSDLKLYAVWLPNSSYTSYGNTIEIKNCPTPPSGTFTIPVGVTGIGKMAFMDCANLTAVVIPSSVTFIASSAFKNCVGLKTVTIPSSVSIIGENAFSGCTALTDVVIPSSVTCINRGAFQNCGSLTAVTIPSGLSYLDDNVFTNCSALNSVTIPSSVTIIGKEVFKGCSALNSIALPTSVYSIQDGAFSGSGLTSVTIPTGVTSIGSKAFNSCANLASVSLMLPTTTLHFYTVLPTDSQAFDGCSSSLKIHVNGTSWPTYRSAVGWSAYATKVVFL